MAESSRPARTPTDAAAGSHRRGTEAPPPAVAAGESFFGRLGASLRGVDLVALLAVPAALVATFALPTDARLELAFSYADPTLYTAFESNFLHLDASHLLFNLGLYALVVPTAYLLSVLGDNREEFYAAFVTFLFVLPVVLSALNLAVPRAGLSLGFSGINMAFVGYLPVALAGYLRHNFGVAGDRQLSGGLFFAGLALVAVLSVRTTVTYAVAGVAALAALASLRAAVTAGTRRPGSSWSLGSGGYLELAAVAVLLFAGGLAAAFPLDPVVDGTVVNVYTHFLGLSLGFLSTYLTVQVAPAVEDSRPVVAVRGLSSAPSGTPDDAS